MIAVAAVLAGCGGGGGGNGLSAEAARFDARLEGGGATLSASGLNCSGLYGRWNVRLEVSGRAKGAGTTAFTLERGHEARAPVSFKIRAGILSGSAGGVLRVRALRNALAIRGLVTVKVPFKKVTQTISTEIPLRRGPAPGCGLSAG